MLLAMAPLHLEELASPECGKLLEERLANLEPLA